MTISDLGLSAIRRRNERRRVGRAGIRPDLAATHLIAGDAIPSTAFPARTSPVTFAIGIAFGAGVHTGLVFEFGDATTAIAAWIDGQLLTLRAGDAGAADRTFAQYDHGAAFPDGRRATLICSVNPGNGVSRVWLDGQDVARGTATNGQLLNGWAAESAGSVMAAAAGALPVDVTQTGAPANFTRTSELTVYAGQLPHHF